MAAFNSPTSQTTSSTQDSGQKNYRGPFAIMTVLFFMWGFMTVFNDILIPRFKEAFTLDYYHAMFVQLAFFGAYFIGSVIYYLISAFTGDPIAKIGYKNGVVIGLLIAAVGSAVFWPAANLAPRSTIIASTDLDHFPSLIQTITQQKDPVSVFIYTNLAESTRQMLNQNSGSDQERLKKNLSDDLDKIINGSAIYDQQRFAGVELQDATRQLLSQNPQGEALVRLNRSLLQDAIPYDSVDAIYATHTRAMDLIKRLLEKDDEWWEEVLEYKTRSIGVLHITRRTALVQSLTHSIRHYAQLATLVRHHGIKADLPLDYLFMGMLPSIS